MFVFVKLPGLIEQSYAISASKVPGLLSFCPGCKYSLTHKPGNTVVGRVTLPPETGKLATKLVLA